MTTNATAIFSIRPRSASWQDRREVVGIEAAVEAVVEVKLTGEGVEVRERTSEENYSYRNARIRKVKREAAHKLAALDAGTPAETGFTYETGRVAVNGVVVGYVYNAECARKGDEYTFVTADGTEVPLGEIEVKLGTPWRDRVGEVATAMAEEIAAQEIMGTDEDAPAVRAAQIEDGEAEAPTAEQAETPTAPQAPEAKPEARRADILPRAVYAQDAVALVRFPLGNGAGVTDVFAWDADGQTLGARLGPVTLWGGSRSDLTDAMHDRGLSLAETRDHLGYHTTIWTRA